MGVGERLCVVVGGHGFGALVIGRLLCVPPCGICSGRQYFAVHKLLFLFVCERKMFTLVGHLIGKCL